MRRSFGGLLAVLISIYPALASAEPWAILGPRAMGMGGAGVAAANGAVGQYWNPASLAQDDTNSHWGLQVPVGVRAEFTGGVLKAANTLGSLSSRFSQIQNAQKTGTALNADTVAAFYQGVNAISDMNQAGSGAMATVAGGGNFKIGRMAFSVNNFTSVGASPFVDTVNIGLGQISGGSGGVNFANAATTLCSGGSCTGAPSDPTNANSATSIQSSLSSQYASLNALTNSALSNNGITSSNIGNVFVNIAATQGGLTPTQIQAAASQIAQNAAAAAPILSAAAANNNPYTNNASNLTVRGVSYTEVAMGYAMPLILPGLLVGGNLKAIIGDVGYSRYNVLQKNAGSTNVLQDFRSNMKQSVQPGLDAGALWNLDEMLPFLPFKPAAGLVLRNINNPHFSEPDVAKANGEPSSYSLNGQARMGVAISPFHFWHVAADLDLTDNLTPVEGYKSRMFGLGTEINVFNRTWINIPLRAGIMKNISDANSKLAYTAGFGLNFLHFMLDVGGSVSSEETTIKTGDSGSTTKVPSNASAAIQLGVMF